MMTRGLHGVLWLGVAGLLVSLSLPGVAQQATTSDADLIRQGPLVLAAAHGEQPRRGGKLLSAGNGKLPHFGIPPSHLESGRNTYGPYISNGSRGETAGSP